MTDTATTSIECRIEGRRRDIGGFEVARVLPFSKRRTVGPFIFFDQMGPAELPPGQGIDVRPHPHIGLATVTYLFDGAMHHRDSLGVSQVIRPGDINWMTAGRGVVHSERTPDPERETGHRLYGVQVWVALPERLEDADPAFHHHDAGALPEISRGGATFRLILGDAWGETSPVEVFSPIFYLHGAIPAGSTTTLDITHDERALYLVEGDVSIDGESISPGEMAVLAPGSAPQISAATDSIVMLCGGQSLGTRKIDWNFVASDASKIQAARADWTRAAEQGFPAGGRFTLPEGETEHIPLPDGKPSHEPVEASKDCPTS